MFKGIYIGWQNFKNSQETGQLATLFILIIVIIFIFIAVTINVSKIALIKTRTANAADATALSLASSIGSIGRYYMYNYLDDQTANCKWDISKLTNWILVIIALITQQWWALAISVINVAVYEAILQPGAIANLNRQLSKLPVNKRLQEQANIMALSMLVKDSQQVQDIHDFDSDTVVVTGPGSRPGQGAFIGTTDTISRFEFWLNQRLAAYNLLKNEMKASIDDIVDNLTLMEIEIRQGTNYSSGELAGWTRSGGLFERLKNFYRSKRNLNIDSEIASLTFKANYLYNSMNSFSDWVISRRLRVDPFLTMWTWFPEFYNANSCSDWWDVMVGDPCYATYPNGWSIESWHETVEDLYYLLNAYYGDLLNSVCSSGTCPDEPNLMRDLGKAVDWSYHWLGTFEESRLPVHIIEAAINQINYLDNQYQVGDKYDLYYSWNEKKGNENRWFHVRVKVEAPVSREHLPKVQAYNNCPPLHTGGELINGTGGVSVSVWYYGPDIPVLYLRGNTPGSLLWNFRFRRTLQSQVDDIFTTHTDTNADGMITYEDLTSVEKARVRDLVTNYGIKSKATAQWGYAKWLHRRWGDPPWVKEAPILLTDVDNWDANGE